MDIVIYAWYADTQLLTEEQKMKSNRIAAYIVITICGLILLAGVVLVTLQWAQRASLSLYGYPYTVRVQPDGKTVGGINTSLLMVLSAAGGIVAVFLIKSVSWGFGAIKKSNIARAIPQ